jgi:Uma2 family endonuclease
LATLIGRFLSEFAQHHDLGIVVGANGMMRLAPGLVRIPDVAFVSWNRLPNREVPREPIPDLAPDLAVEVLSKGNTPTEMDRKLHDYFQADVRLVWYVDPPNRSVRVFRSVDESWIVAEDETLDGGDVLPGFQLKLSDLFREPLPSDSSSKA